MSVRQRVSMLSVYGYGDTKAEAQKDANAKGRQAQVDIKNELARRDKELDKEYEGAVNHGQNLEGQAVWDALNDERVQREVWNIISKLPAVAYR